MKNIIVASKNPVKIRASLDGFQRMFPGQTFNAAGVSVASDVSHQPMTDTETRDGARNRAVNARNAAPDADFWVGIEGGVEYTGTEMHAFAWVVVLSQNERMGMARSASFSLPNVLADLVRSGVELGEADDRIFGRQNSKQDNGAVGILTGDVVDRAALYVMPVELALIPFRRDDLYFD
jgi:inosine/xanthosine triphosphatase